MTRNEIANLVVNSDKVVGADDLTNRERFAMICSVFRCDSVAFEERFDFDNAIHSSDPIIIYAALQLASLQFEYFTRLHLSNLIDEERYEWWISYLELAKAKLRWTFSFVRFGQEAPPYPFIN